MKFKLNIPHFSIQTKLSPKLIIKNKMQPSDQQSFKKKREQFSITIRKTNRDNLISKRRNLQQLNQVQGDDQDNGNGNRSQKLIIVDETLRSYLIQIMKEKYEIGELPNVLELMGSRDILEKHRAVYAIRCMSNQVNQDNLEHMLNSNTFDLLVNWYTQSDYPQIKLETLWIFTNLSSFSKEVSAKLVEKNILPVLSEDLLNVCEPIQFQAIWAIGNIAADDTKYRDELIGYGSIIKIIKYLDRKRTNNEILTAVWALSNLARGHPSPKYDAVKFVIPPVAQALKSGIIKNEQIISDCLWTLANLSEGPKIRLQRIMQTGVLGKVMSYLRNPNLMLSIPSLRLIGNFTSGNKQQTNQILRLNFLDQAYALLDSPKNVIIKQVCWAVSNITAGTDQQILQFLQRQDLIQKLLKIYPDHIPDIKMEIIWIFTNLERCSIPEIILNVFQVIKLIGMICQQLKEKIQRCQFQGLTCLYRVLALAEKCAGKTNKANTLKNQLITLGYVPVLESLQKHESQKIYRQCQKVMQRFFDLEEETSMRDV